jgi:starvation-inducible DNA-binding protein
VTTVTYTHASRENDTHAQEETSMAHATQVLSKDVVQKSAAELQIVLVDLLDLGLQGKQAHWNVVGPQFRALLLELDDVVDDSRKWSDAVAERLRALGVAADGRASIIAKRSGIESLPEGTISDKEVLIHVTDQLAAVAARCLASIDHLNGADKVSEDILIQIVEGLEKHVWMFRSQQA